MLDGWREEPTGNGALGAYDNLNPYLNTVGSKLKQQDESNVDWYDCCYEMQQWAANMPKEDNGDWTESSGYIQNGVNNQAIRYCIYQTGFESNLPIMERTKDHRFRPVEAITIAEVNRAALRYYEAADQLLFAP